MTKILLIDDDEKLGELLTTFFERFDMNLVAATHPDEGLRQLEAAKPDLVILDVMLPGQDGFEVCRTIRRSSNIPIIMLTARGEVTDRIVGLEIGADDYLPKPFEPRLSHANWWRGFKIFCAARRTAAVPMDRSNSEI
jgi:OmpR family response regulator RpaB